MQSTEESRRRGRSGTALQDRFDELSELRPSGKIVAIGGEIDAGQDDLAKALLRQTGCGRDDLVLGDRARWSSPIGNDAEGAAMIAAGLHAEKGARVILDAFDERQSFVAPRHDVGDHVAVRLATPACRRGLVGIAEHLRDFRHGGKALRIDLSGAAGDDDLAVWMLALQTRGSSGPLGGPLRSSLRKY